MREFMQRKVPARFRELSGDPRPLRFLAVSDAPSLIPHWLIEGV
jgi:hypothetical protein